MLTGHIYQSNLSRIRHKSHRQSLITITRDISSFKEHQPFEQPKAISNKRISACEGRDAQIVEADDVRSSRPDMFVCSQEKPSKGIGRTKQLVLARRHTSSTYWCRAYCSSFGTIIRWRLSEPRVLLGIACRENTGESDKPEVDSFSVNMIYFLPAGWASSYGHSLRFEKTNGLYTRCLSTFNIVPFSSPIFDLVKTGQLIEVKRLFRGQSASVFDVDPYGWTLLHVSYDNAVYYYSTD